MIISEQAGLLIMQRCLKELTMSILTAIIQAVFQAITFIFPISESGHSGLFHDFAGRTDTSGAMITGVIHIGIAIGIIIALYKLLLSLSMEFFSTWGDIFTRKIKGSTPTPKRKFMYYSLLSFAPMLFWLIPTGKNGFLFSLLKKTGYNATVFDDGIFFLITGALLMLAIRQLNLSKNDKNINLVFALVTGFASLLLLPVSGLSFIGGIFCILMLLGVSKKISLRYAFVLAAPVLIVLGIIEICTAATPAGIAAIIIGLVLSAGVSFICVKILQWVINNDKLKYFAYYDLGIGVIALIIGIFELILK
jgi:undecaprenyl pyrophosphate phosphatase UppP